MPIVRVELWSGRDRDFKTDLARAITDVVVEKVGCPVEAVTVKIDESPMENWVIGGKPAPDMHKE
jgi:4-oxalocrotonate tautomerase